MINRARVMAAAGLASAALFVAGCGEKEAAEADAVAAAKTGARGVYDACTLLSPADVEKEFAKVFEEPIARSVGGGDGEGLMTSCSYASQSSDGVSGEELRAAMAGTVYVSLQLWWWPEEARAADYHKTLRDGAGSPSETVADLGDEAFRFTDGVIDGVHVRDGAIGFSLSVSQQTMSAADDLATEEELARMVLARL